MKGKLRPSWSYGPLSPLPDDELPEGWETAPKIDAVARIEDDGLLALYTTAEVSERQFLLAAALAVRGRPGTMLRRDAIYRDRFRFVPGRFGVVCVLRGQTGPGSFPVIAVDLEEWG